MKFEGDAFISYAHLDNVELVEGHKGWVANLHRALEIRVGQLLGKPSQIWRDPKLHGNDVFAATIAERLQRVASLVSVVSPRYVKSEWGRKELIEFCRAAAEQGGLRVHDKARIFKVLKTPVPLEMHPPELQPLLGYEFFKVDPETGKVRELDEIFGPEAQRDFWIRLDDLAHDMCCLLEMLEDREPPPGRPWVNPEGATVFLAETTSDLREARGDIKRDLQQHGYTVLPDRPLPLTTSDVKTAVLEDLARSVMSIHMVGKTYSLVPEGGTESLVEIQNELAIQRGQKGSFSRLVWIAPGLSVEDERQRKVIEQLRLNPGSQKAADLLETPLEDLRTLIDAWLTRAEKPPREAGPSRHPQADSAQIYMIYDKRDADVMSPWEDFLFSDFEVLRPVFEGDEAEIREYHEENLQSCDGALIFYGTAGECWLRRKLRELQKSAGYGRTKPPALVAICLAPPKTADKVRFRTHEAMLIPQWDGFSPDSMEPFVTCLKGGEEGRQGDAAGSPV